jgi:hypothetical protein
MAFADIADIAGVGHRVFPADLTTALVPRPARPDNAATTV